MAEKKKMGAGLVLSVITALVTVAGLVLYMICLLYTSPSPRD